MKEKFSDEFSGTKFTQNMGLIIPYSQIYVDLFLDLIRHVQINNDQEGRINKIWNLFLFLL